MLKKVCFQKPNVPTNINYVCVVESNIWAYFVRNIAVVEWHNFYKMCKWNDTFGTIPKILRWLTGIEIHHMRETMKGFCLWINFLHSGIKALLYCRNRRDWSSNCSLDLHWNTGILSEKQYFPFEAVYIDRQKRIFSVSVILDSMHMLWAVHCHSRQLSHQNFSIQYTTYYNNPKFEEISDDQKKIKAIHPNSVSVHYISRLTG